MTAVQFQNPPASALTRRRGRPEKFNAEVQAALTAKPGEWAVIQTVKSASRASVLRRQYPTFEFTHAPVEGGEGVNIFARFPEVVAAVTDKPKATARKRAPRKAPAKA